MTLTRTINDAVCATPFPFTGTQTEKRASGLQQISNYTGLVALTALAAGPDGIQKGDVIFVSGKDVKTYGNQKMKLPDGTECIFVPKSSVFLVEQAAPAQPRPMPLSVSPLGCQVEHGLNARCPRCTGGSYGKVDERDGT